jgi:hypothetical protein
LVGCCGCPHRISFGLLGTRLSNGRSGREGGSRGCCWFSLASGVYMGGRGALADALAASLSIKLIYTRTTGLQHRRTILYTTQICTHTHTLSLCLYRFPPSLLFLNSRVCPILLLTSLFLTAPPSPVGLYMQGVFADFHDIIFFPVPGKKKTKKT